MNNYTPMTNPVLTAGGVNGYTNAQQSYNVNPYTRLTIEQQNYLNQQQQQQYVTQNDPYTSGSTLLAQCSDLVRSKIMQDNRYKQIDYECEMMIKQYLYGNVIPQILNSQNGRIAFEKWEQTIKELKQEFSKEEVAMTQNINVLLNDPIVAARLQELQNQSQQVQTNVQQVVQPKAQPKVQQTQQLTENIESGDIA